MTTPQSPWAGAIPAAAYLIFVAAACVGWQLFAARSAIPPALELADVAEPISFTGASLSDFDDIWAIRFRDARGVDWEASLAEIEGDVTLRRGGFEWRLSIAGPGEKSLLGLLEGWAVADPEARRIIEGEEARVGGRGQSCWRRTPSPVAPSGRVIASNFAGILDIPTRNRRIHPKHIESSRVRSILAARPFRAVSAPSVPEDHPCAHARPSSAVRDLR